MIGGLTGRPLSNSTGPGHADADPAHVVGSATDFLEQLVEALGHPARAPASGRAAMSRSAARSASGVPPRSLTATRACVAPRSATRTTPASRLNASTVAGRPPVEALAAGLVDEPLREQRVHTLGDGRAGEAGLPREIGARDRAPPRGSGAGARRRWSCEDGVGSHVLIVHECAKLRA